MMIKIKYSIKIYMLQRQCSIAGPIHMAFNFTDARFLPHTLLYSSNFSAKCFKS